MKKNDLSLQVLCRIKSIQPLEKPINQDRVKDGKLVATKRLPFTYSMDIIPSIADLELTGQQADIILDKTFVLLTAREMEIMRLKLRCIDFVGVCNLVSTCPPNDLCLATLDYSQFTVGDEYIGSNGNTFHFEPTEKHPTGSMRYNFDLSRSFFGMSEALREKFFDAHVTAQTKYIEVRTAEETSAYSIQQAERKRQAEQARATKQKAMDERLGIIPDDDDDDDGDDADDDNTSGTSPKTKSKTKSKKTK